MIAGIEFFLLNGEIQFVEDGHQRLFCELDVALAARLRDVMDNDPKVLKGLEILGIKDPIEQIKQFIHCQFGDFTKQADITSDGILNTEYWECGNRPCSADGLLCKFPAAVHGSITNREAELIREVAHDHSNKMIANTSHRSKFTVDTQLKHISRKLGCYTRAGIASFAGQNNLL